MSTPPNNLKEIIANAQMLVDANLPAAAESLFAQYGLKSLKIIDGKVVDLKDLTQVYLEKFITVDKDMLTLKQDVQKLADTEYEILIVGPTGTGKEIIAQALHSRREGKFRAVNCAGLPETLIESELFGYMQGAFTGALRNSDGLLQQARDGTIFLDEISELPLQAQGKLLRALQTKKVRKVGGKDDELINCRFVFASNRSIEKMCIDGLFRIDLYARISTFELQTKSLEERACDIEPIYKALGAYDTLIKHVIENKTIHPFNVRSIEQNIKRNKVLGKLP